MKQLFIAMTMLAAAQTAQGQEKRPYAELAQSVEHELRAELALFYPRCVDAAGGFKVAYREDWTPGTDASRLVVTQARMTWVAAEVASRRPELCEQYLVYAKHGLAYLNDVMWDKERGGLYWSVDAVTRQAEEKGRKHLYGTVFGLYAAANAYRATQDPVALDLAKRIFEWMERHAHDREHGGYLEAFERDGSPMLKVPDGESRYDLIGTLYGYKSMNAHIHTLEALTELYRVWPDATVRARVEEVIDICCDKLYAEPGCLHMYLTRDLRAVPNLSSYGHDVETTFLLDEAEAVIGRPREKTARIGRAMVDHALDFGWDGKQGGMYYEGSAFKAPVEMDKEWWTQAESANALLLLAEKYPQARYFDYFVKQWTFITDYQIDRTHGGWYQTVGADGKPVSKAAKAHGWKMAYHNGRAMMNMADRLKAMAEQGSGAEGKPAAK